MTKKHLEIRNNEIPDKIVWDLVSEVHVYGWASPDTMRFLQNVVLVQHKKGYSLKDHEAIEAGRDAVSIDERH
jgi:hypothetical protein